MAFQNLDHTTNAHPAAQTFHSTHDNHAATIHVIIHATDHAADFRS
jgi:hypothetical protein